MPLSITVPLLASTLVSRCLTSGSASSADFTVLLSVLSSTCSSVGGANQDSCTFSDFPQPAMDKAPTRATAKITNLCLSFILFFLIRIYLKNANRTDQINQRDYEATGHFNPASRRCLRTCS